MQKIRRHNHQVWSLAHGKVEVPQRKDGLISVGK
jgi:hypothetical protein